jgi:hypothetical protein
MDWTTRQSRFDPRQRQRVFPLTSVSRPALRPTHPPVQWVLGVKRGRGVMLTTHPHLVPRSWMRRSYTSSPPLRLHGCVVGLLYLYYHSEEHCVKYCNVKWEGLPACTQFSVLDSVCDIYVRICVGTIPSNKITSNSQFIMFLKVLCIFVFQIVCKEGSKI